MLQVVSFENLEDEELEGRDKVQHGNAKFNALKRFLTASLCVVKPEVATALVSNLLASVICATYQIETPVTATATCASTLNCFGPR